MRTVMAVAAVLVAATSLHAQGWIEPGRPGPGAVVKLRTEVSARVEGRVARVQVEEWFENRGGAVAEGSYLYPLPGEAVFSSSSPWKRE
jgi:hypothetical protein